MANKHTADVVIIGAGLSGLTAAKHLQDAGKSVIVLDKARSVGGRLATRRIGGGIADHGAQFFTIRDNTFKAAVDQWIEDEVVFLWSMGFSDGSLIAPGDDGHERFAARGGMNALAKHLAKDLNDVRVNVLVTNIQPYVESWLIHDEQGGEYIAKAVILTSPVPQSLDIIKNGKAQLEPSDLEALKKIEYAPCLTAMFHMSANVRLPNPGVVQRRNSSISWMANNKQKGISDTTIITVQADGQYSQQLWEESDERVIKALMTDLRVYLPEGAEILESQIKRWRYSLVKQTHPDRFLKAQKLPPLIFAGDAFGGPRVEGAYLSGLASAKHLIETMK